MKKYYEENLELFPISHVKYFEKIKKNKKIKSFINDKDKKALSLYNECLDKLKYFRLTHKNIIHEYVINSIKKEKSNLNGSKNELESIGTNETEIIEESFPYIIFTPYIIFAFVFLGMSFFVYIFLN